MPIEADHYLYINCLWVFGSLKGHGYSSVLLNHCIQDAQAQNCKGIWILSSIDRKKEYLEDPKNLRYKGFEVADVSDCGIAPYYLSLNHTAAFPEFREASRHPVIQKKGFVLHYSGQCPFATYWAERLKNTAKQNGITMEVIHITDRNTVQNLPSPISV